MTWEQEPLWAKARLFLHRALEQSREDPQFGLWCALGLEMLARSAVASVSPTLLAEPNRDQKNLLFALGRGDPRAGPRSIGAVQVVVLCGRLFEGFTTEHAKSARALIAQRNMELHSGLAAFSNYSTQDWVAGFYGCCHELCEAMGETLETLLGPDEAGVAREVMSEAEGEVQEAVHGTIAEHRRVFQRRGESERADLAAGADEEAKQLARARHHGVTCPACGSAATVQGEPFGPARVFHDEDLGEVVVRQAISPRRFRCSACGLGLNGFGELRVASLANQYTRTTRYSPEEYFELINPDDTDTIRDLATDYFESMASHEYDNE